MVSTYHLKMKFPTGHGVGEVCGDQAAARICSVQAAKAKQIYQVDDLDVRGEDKDDRIKPSTDIISFELVPGNPEKVTYIGADLPDRSPELLAFLRENSEVLAWTPFAIPGVNPMVITHRLNVNPDVKPIQQKRRSYD